MKTTTRQAAHGTQYLYELTYTQSDPGFGEATWRTWAYSLDHAVDRFWNAPDSDGWILLRGARVPEGAGAHRATQHQIGATS